MVRRSYNIADTNDVLTNGTSGGLAPLAEEERTGTPDIEKNFKDERKEHKKDIPTVIALPGLKCYWCVATLVGIACLTLVIVLALMSGLIIEGTKPITKTSEEWIFTDAKLIAYPRLTENPDDSSEIVICKKSINEVINSTETLLREYSEFDQTYYQNCEEKHNISNVDTRPCWFNTSTLSNSACSAQNQYGLKGPSISPCFFLRIEESIGWIPEYLDNSSTLIYHPDFMAVTCEPKAPVNNDVPILHGPVLGFPKHFFPESNFDNSTKFLAPLIAFQVLNPPSEVDILIECQLHVKNARQLKFQGKANIKLRILNGSDCHNKTSEPFSTVQPNVDTTTEDPVQGRNPDPIDLDETTTTSEAPIIASSSASDKATNPTNGTEPNIQSSLTPINSTDNFNSSHSVL